MEDNNDHVPEWALRHFRNFKDTVLKARAVTVVAAVGSGVLHGLLGAFEKNPEVEKISIANSTIAVDAIQKSGWEYIKQQWKEHRSMYDEPTVASAILLGQATITLWSALECFVRDFLADWVDIRGESKRLDQVRNVKVGFADFLSMSVRQRNYELVKAVEEKIDFRDKGGATRFVRLFEAFGVKVELDGEPKKMLWECWNIRNLIAHHMGIVDEHFVQRCPSLGKRVGDKVDVDVQSYMQFVEAAGKFGLAIRQGVVRYLREKETE